MKNIICLEIENLEKEYLPTIYNNYLAALIETKNYNKAEYIINKQISSYNDLYRLEGLPAIIIKN